MSREQAQTRQLESETMRVRVPIQLMPLSGASHRQWLSWPLLYEWYLMRSDGKTASQPQKIISTDIVFCKAYELWQRLTKIYHLVYLHIPKSQPWLLHLWNQDLKLTNTLCPCSIKEYQLWIPINPLEKLISWLTSVHHQLTTLSYSCLWISNQSSNWPCFCK